MNEEPYRNEPSFETERVPGDIKRYNQCIKHETLRVAVIDMLKQGKEIAMPEPLTYATAHCTIIIIIIIM
jgi:ubiquitin-conjugating enzyme E2 Z